ncbi:two-component regulator propeller domain-containing protein [Williamwhitmania taraxaci]|uniref:Serine phosphatase RsbU, regulator of sigma subunit n=1 Tax=Williamwhitmania taraxaci TaxID=1640674 RepID=A0A1G6R7L6_9BACT|nr:two-component regulator propeller domain-containing protein [Williamwhitmania taraxaci]SDD00085.1 Serine phosphatase RsbU, regulator of sigma subunit [Williamwhitmania taraxaci]
MKRSFAIILSIIVFANVLWAQENPIYTAKVTLDRYTKFENFTTKNGLSDNRVTAIFQDSRGYMWFGTAKGLNRFDGYSFIVFSHTDSLSISSNEVTSIVEDKHGYLWIGTSNGLNRLDPRNGKFTHFYADASPKSILKNSAIRALLYTSDGFLWVDCEGGVLSKIELEFMTVRHFMRKGQTNSNYPFSSMIECRNGKSIIAGGASSPVITINKDNNSSEELPVIRDGKGGLFIQGVSDFTYDSKGNLWMGQIHDYLVMLDAKTGTANNMRFRSKYAVKSDGKGNIWLGGYRGGLIQYSEDKNEITQYQYNQDNPFSIAGDQISRIYPDRSGCIWIATDGGLSKYSVYANKFSHFFHIPETESLPSNKVTCFAEGVDGIVWIGTQDRGLVRFDRNGSHFETIGFDRENTNAIESPYITSISIDSKGVLWLSLWDGKIGGLNSYDPKKRKATRFKTNVDYRWFSKALVGPRDEIYAGTWGVGLCIFDPKKGNYSDVVNGFSRRFSGNDGSTYSIVRDRNDRIWFSTKGYPFYFNPILNTFENFQPSISPKFQGPEIAYSKGKTIPRLPFPHGAYTPFLDADGNPWLYSKDGNLISFSDTRALRVLQLSPGINCITPANDGVGFWVGIADKIEYVNSHSGLRKPLGSSIPTGEIYAVYEENNYLFLGCHTGLIRLKLSKDRQMVVEAQKVYSYPVRAFCSNGVNVYIGADNGLFRLDSGRIKVVGSGLVKAPQNIFVHSFFLNSEGDFFVGTSDGLYFLPSCNKIFKHYPCDATSETSLHSNNILSIAQDIKGLVWLGTESYVSTFDRSTQKFFTYNLPGNDALSSSLISDMLFDSKGNLWIGTTTKSGLNRLNLATGYIDYFVSRSYQSKGLKGNEIVCLFEDSKKRIWVGTEVGLNLLLPNGRDFALFDKKTCLPTGTINSILEDAHGNLWLATENGLCCIDLVRNTTQRFTVGDGLQHNKFAPRSAIKLRSGELLFGGEAGFNLIDPDSVSLNHTPPIAGISGVWVNGKRLFYEAASLKTIELKHSERNINFELTSLDFNYPEKNRYAYQLEGYDTTWIETVASDRLVQYSNLGPGHYLFRLKSCNSDGVWSAEEVCLAVVVDSPFWQDWWFIVLSLIFISGFVFFIGELRERRLRNDKLLLEKTVADRTSILLAQREEIISQRDALQRQHNEIERYNYQLSESLEFAKHLQDSHMQSASELDIICSNHFLIYQPKYLVGGDFYWANNVNDNVIFCVVDCTGHGVPGALMSMVGLVAIKDVVLNQKLYDPAQVLESVHQKIVSTLTAGNPGDSVSSAMDVAFGVLNRKTGTLRFSGAHCPIFIIRDAYTTFPSLIEIPGDKRLVGSPLFRSNFTNHTIEVAKGDMIYLFTDGLVDQLEEHLRRKFSRSLAREMFTEIACLGMDEQRTEILRRITEWKGTDTQTDDITVFGIRV